MLMADILSLGADHWIEAERKILGQSLRSADWFSKTAGGGVALIEGSGEDL